MDTNFKDFIFSILKAYRISATDATKGIAKNWIIVITSIIAHVVLLWTSSMLSHAGMAGGFVVGLIQIALLTLYYSWIRATVEKERITLETLIQFDYSLFSGLISVAFVVYLVTYFVRPFAQDPNTVWVYYCIQLGIVLVFNSVPETIYIQKAESIDALSRSMNFVKENWIEWYLPLIVIFAPWLFLSATTVLLSLAGGDVLLPVLPVVDLSVDYISAFIPYLSALVLGVVIGNWFMIFRGHLFKHLESSTRRRRMFDARVR